MVLDTGVEMQEGSLGDTPECSGEAIVQLVGATTIPGRCVVVVRAQVCNLVEGAQTIWFEPGVRWMMDRGTSCRKLTF